MTVWIASSLSRFLPILFLIALMCGMPMGVFAQAEEEGSTAEAPLRALEYSVETLTDDVVVGDFVVGPGKTELELAPGDSAIVEIIVTNRMGELRQFNFEVEDVTGSESPEKAVVLLGDDRGPYTLKDYITLPEEHIDLAHGERARVPVRITIPPDAEPGGRYGSVLVTTVTKDAEAGSTAGAAPQSALITRIGTLFFVKIEGDVLVSGALEDFVTIPEKKWFSEGPIRFGLYYRNEGSLHLNPYGEIRITNMFGEEVGFQEVEPWFALPNSLRFREVVWDRDFLFGKYTAHASINRGYEDIIDAREYTFWVLPWDVMAIGFLIIFVSIFLIRLFFKTFEFRRK